MSDYKLLGILGGMGPSATLNFAEELIRQTPATTDQEHIPTIIHNDPTIPDRNAAILRDGKSPLPSLRENAATLEEQGVDAIVIPCNTAHYYYDELNVETDVRILNLIESVKNRLEKNNSTKAGILSTTTVLEANIYNDYFDSSGIELVTPNSPETVMNIIYAVKEGDYATAQSKFDTVLKKLESRDTDSIIIACTDLSLLSPNTAMDVFDSTTILAEKCVSEFKVE